MSLVDEARIFATQAHGATGQRRKYTGEPYIVHPTAVVDLLKGAGITDQAMLCAAWLHDVLEDCPAVAACEIGASFGPEVEAMVWVLTNIPAGQGLNRASRKAADLKRISESDGRVQTIKVADLIDNTSSIVEHDPTFAKVYMAEKRSLLIGMARANTVLWNRAWDIVEDYFGKQGIAA
jgi:(p)ppGpp synthase/HD superfamily hydrolase